jgi:4-hydroxysphinganine ceramide fatty acyl 2-hydroxylase
MYADLSLIVLYMCVLFGAGVVAWTLLEYFLHRYVFHWHPNPKSYRQLTAHFLLHGIHHKVGNASLLILSACT